MKCSSVVRLGLNRSAGNAPLVRSLTSGLLLRTLEGSLLFSRGSLGPARVEPVWSKEASTAVWIKEVEKNKEQEEEPQDLAFITIRDDHYYSRRDEMLLKPTQLPPSPMIHATFSCSLDPFLDASQSESYCGCCDL